jgi:hypothetical protein
LIYSTTHPKLLWDRLDSSKWVTNQIRKKGVTDFEKKEVKMALSYCPEKSCIAREHMQTLSQTTY